MKFVTDDDPEGTSPRAQRLSRYVSELAETPAVREHFRKAYRDIVLYSQHPPPNQRCPDCEALGLVNKA